MDSPDVTMPQNTPDQSTLASAVVGNSPPQMPSLHEEGGLDQNAPAPQARSGGRLLGTLASIVSAGLAGIPDKGRPSFITGLGSGTRSAQAAEANQQNIKFASFNDSVRAAQMHNEDLRMQWAGEDHQTAVQANSDAQAKRMTDTTGMTYTFVPNDDGGKAVQDHMGVQMAQNGAVSVPAGTISGPKGWYIPNKGSAEQAQANTKDYNSRASFYGFNPTSNGQVVNDIAYDQLRQASNGLDNQGHPMHADDIQARVDNMKEQLAKFKENANANPNTIAAVQSDISHLTNIAKITDAREQSALDDAAQRKTDQQKQIIDQKATDQEKVNASKPQKAGKPDTNMYVGTDATGNQIAGTSDDLKTAGAQGVTKLDSDTGKKVVGARELISPDGLFNAVAQNVKTLTANGKIGTAASRWNDFMAGKVGEGDPDFQALRTNMGLLATKLMQVHVGARGSHEMLEHFQNLADYRIADASTLGSALKSEYRYVHGVAMLPKAGAR